MTLREHYVACVLYWGHAGHETWHASAEVTWRAFCMSWVSIAWAMLIGAP